MKRIFLFLATNMAVMFLVGMVFQLFGIQGLLQENGVDLNLTAVLLMSAVVGFSGSIISLMMSKSMAKRSMGVQVITQPKNETERWLLAMVERQAKEAGIGMPEVGIFNDAQPNAFATGANKNSALVAASAGLLQHMNRDEVEAVMAHEISHVANGDMVTLTLIQGVVNTFVMFLASVIGHIVDRVILKNERGHGIGYFISSMVAQVVLSIFATMIVMWFSRQREYRADAGGAKLAGRQKMISALQRLQSVSQPSDLPDEMAAFGISGSKAMGLKALFLSHPPLEQRIEALRHAG